MPIYGGKRIKYYTLLCKFHVYAYCIDPFNTLKMSLLFGVIISGLRYMKIISAEYLCNKESYKDKVKTENMFNEYRAGSDIEDLKVQRYFKEKDLL
jgi:hypothetical protein